MCSTFCRIHSDVWGSSSVKSMKGYRYYVVFIDDQDLCGYFHYSINQKFFFSIFVKFYNYVKVQFRVNIKSQSDEGGEFSSNSFKEFLQDKWMTYRVSCLYTPQQNNLAELRHRHIFRLQLVWWVIQDCLWIFSIFHVLMLYFLST